MKSGRMGRASASPGAAREAIGGEVISSRENRWLKEFRVALRGGVATSGGAVGVEGVRLVEEALTSGCRVEAVLFSESGERWRERLAPMVSKAELGFPVLRTTDRLFEGIADTEHPQGVAALVVPRVFTLEEMVRGAAGSDSSGAEAPFAGRMPEPLDSGEELKLRPPKKKGAERPRAALGMTDLNMEWRNEENPREQRACAALLVVLAGVQDPGNVGTIVRTAAAFGATGVITAATGQSGTASPFAPKALRASAGAALHMPMLTGMALGILLTQLKMAGIRTVASCVHEEGGDRPYLRRASGGAMGSGVVRAGGVVGGK